MGYDLEEFWREHGNFLLGLSESDLQKLGGELKNILERRRNNKNDEKDNR